ncbi:MAG TPA: hypothetical protein PLL96_04120 [Syntrophorhabdaceae bacterium]|nr:hypothetical protein [Syntrophorhabdaceae bacterium]HOL06470.1 hypothetical protein [Syntrophorhabdaceae bacterium]HOT43141.1 hypothetical protein [Syntrophorhabdaceae bacterium]HPC66469.1 hypothetical protein [Syntrophorhabdaceae bacterium]HPP42765.1 hypothetical protein [Syntrophorhabdaceae bacterium]
MKDYTVDDLRRIARPRLGDKIPLELFRILRIIGMREILGDSSGAALYMIGKKVGNMIGADDIDSFKSRITELKIGIPEVEILDDDHLVVKLYECITCAGFSYTGEMFCDMESGIIAGMLEKVYNKKARSTQKKSWTAGYNYCEFHILLY